MKQNNNVVENKNTKAVKAGLWYTVSNIAVKAIMIITTPIFTRMMTTSDYGLANTFTSWYNLLLVISSLNLAYSVGRAKLDFKDQLEEYVGSLQVLSILFTLVMGAVMCVFIEPVATFMELNKPLVILLILYLLAEPAIYFTRTKFRYQYRYKGNIAIAAYTTIGVVVVTLFFMLFFKTDRYYARVLGSVLPAVLLSIVFWILSIKKKTIMVNFRYWKYGLEISVPLILHSISLNVLSQSDRIMITKYCGADYSGIYGLAYSYAILINIILGSINEAWLPWFHDSYYAEETDAIRKKVKPLILFGGMLGIGSIAITPEAMMILGPSDYQAGKWVVPPIALGVVCQFIYQQYVHIELHLKKTKYISYGTVIAAILNIGLNVIFIPKYGFIAAAYTSLFCYIVLMIVHLLITRVILKVHLYDDWYMFVTSVCVSAVAVGFMLLYDKILVRYIILSLLCILFLVFNRDNIKIILQKKKR